METSDSEYFESADEDFEPEKELNKNKISTKDNSIENLTKNVNTLYTSDINKNKKENTEVENHDNKKSLQSSISANNATIEYHRPEASISLTKEKNKFESDDGEKNFHTNPCENANSDKDTKDDNLWNDEEGWGVDDEVVNEDYCNLQNDIHFANISPDVKDINKKEENTSKSDTTEEKNMWDTEEWDNWESVNEESTQVRSTKYNEENSQQNNAKCDVDSSSSNSNQLWKGWGNWGVTSILSTATQSVSTLTSSVSQGISTVLETGIGAPDPEKLAILNSAEENLLKSDENLGNRNEEHENKNLLGFGLSNFGNLVSGVSKLVETTGTKVISGGLDTLETIGKKTMEVIQDGDPGLKRKRAFLNLEGEKPVLSQVLREAKEKAEEENKARQEKHFTRKVNYESIFDDHQGLVHLEALEMLSKQCDMKLQLLIESNSGSTLTEIQETLDQVKELCELPDEEEDEQLPLEDLKDKLKTAVEEIGINITYDKLISLWEETECWLNNLSLNICDENEIHEQAVETLAQLTAIAVEQFHKAGELLLIKDHRSTADEADSLVQ